MRLWTPGLGGEVFYQQDLPACCSRSAREAEDAFECGYCGAGWQAVLPVEPEECAFVEREKEERRGAA
ncbi:MAG: hypothetical protein AB1425_14205 [Actinomycetota bacterium]